MSDYLAVITFGVGSCNGRDPDKEKAISRAIRELKGFGHIYNVSSKEVKINVLDVDGHNEIIWGSDGWYADGKKFAPEIEVVTRVTPNWK